MSSPADGWLSRTASALGPSSVILRHAERYPVPSISDSLGVGLTAKGMEDSIRFGESITGHRRVRLFHSPAVRCRETAEGIADGLRSNDHEVTSIEESSLLCAPYLKDPRVLRDADRLGHGFMRAWFEGRFDHRWLLPTPQAADMVLSQVVSGLSSDAEAFLDIHVSHDWEVVLLREELLGIRYENAGWVGYLTGLAFTVSDGGYVASSPEGQSRFVFRGGRRCRS